MNCPRSAVTERNDRISHSYPTRAAFHATEGGAATGEGEPPIGTTVALGALTAQAGALRKRASPLEILHADRVEQIRLSDKALEIGAPMRPVAFSGARGTCPQRRRTLPRPRHRLAGLDDRPVLGSNAAQIQRFRGASRHAARHRLGNMSAPAAFHVRLVQRRGSLGTPGP